MHTTTKTLLKIIGFIMSVVCFCLITFGIIVKHMGFDDGLTRKIKFLVPCYLNSKYVHFSEEQGTVLNGTTIRLCKF